MHMAWFQWGGAATAAVLALLTAAPLRAADDSGVRPVAEELGQRTKPAAAPESAAKGRPQRQRRARADDLCLLHHSRSSSRALTARRSRSTRSDPNKFLIPDDDARRVIRAATRSAYAEACELRDLAQANYQTMMQERGGQEGLERAAAPHDQCPPYVLGVLFLGRRQDHRSTRRGPLPTADHDLQGRRRGGRGSGGAEMVAPKRPQCPPEQKQKVMNAINAYVQAAHGAPAARLSAGAVGFRLQLTLSRIRV